MTRILADGDRRFFSLLSEAAATNPFSDAFLGLQCEIADCDAALPADERLERILARVTERMSRLDAHEHADASRFRSGDRELLRRAFLFATYHRFVPLFDQLIGDQVGEGDRSIAAPFSTEVIAELVGRGFSRDEARRYFAIYYQIRRAFYFIDRGLVGRSECMKQLRRHLWNNVFTDDIRLYERHLWDRMEDFSTVLLGATGTGKGTAAAAIGRSGYIPFDEGKGTFTESFVGIYNALNLSQFPESLLESELFGHRKGAFTGAIEAHQGIFARCSPHGAIFLDEIGDMSVPVQIKLLNVLQERTFSPVGSHEKLRFRGRIIAATNRSLDELRASGQFRDDFFYRLCSDIILVPSLRQRIAEDPAELDDLVSLIVGRIAGQADTEVVEVIRQRIVKSPGKDYAWPGNVRELEQAVRRILLTRHYQADDRAVAPDLSAQLQAGIDGGSLDAGTLLSGYCALLYERYGTYEEVARRTNLDRRTAKANIRKFELSRIGRN